MIIIPANTLSTGGFDVANSLRFNDGSSDNLSRSTGTPSSRQKFTFSTWIKLSSVSGNRSIFNIETDGNTTLFFMVKNGDQLHFVDYNSSAEQAKLTTNALYRDPSAWMHVVLRLDSTQGTNTNRCRLYVNGSEVTSFSATVYPSQNYNFTNNVGNTRIGVSQGNANYWDGYMAETVYCDNQSLAPDQFGEFDEDSGIWKPIDVSGLTFGDEGFYLDYENSGALGADVSGNSNNFTVNNLTAIDQSTDTCTNNFATLNPLIPSSASFLEGNLRCNFASSGEYGSDSSIGITSGKWYAEFKFTAGANHYLILGVNDQNGQNERSRSNGSAGKGGTTGTIGYRCSDGQYRVNNSHTSYGGSGGDGDIFSIAIDKDNGKVYFAVNGTYGNSGNPATNSNGIDVSSVLTGDTWFFNVGNDTGASETQVEANFGSPSFAISSGNTDGNGYGNFEYAVPSGYYSLNTKNLAEYG